MNMFRKMLVVGATLMLVGAGCSSKPATQANQQPTTPPAPLSLASTAFANGQPIPDKYTCNGQDFSPPVVFSNVPPNAVSLALTMEDKDAPYVHWALFNIPPTQPGIAEGDVAPGSSANSTGGKMGYDGPCPPAGETHHYVFTLYALNDAINLQDGASADDLKSALDGKTIQQSELSATYGKAK